MLKVLLIAVFLHWSGVASADTFVWTDNSGGNLIIGIGRDQVDAWRNVSASSISGWSEDGLNYRTLVEACRAPGWYARFHLHDANINRTIDRGVCGATSREDARRAALRSCQTDNECNSLLNGPQTWIDEGFGFDSGSNSWLPTGTGGFYFLQVPGEKWGHYRCAGNDPNNKGRDAKPYCGLTSDGNINLPETRTRRQMATGQ